MNGPFVEIFVCFFFYFQKYFLAPCTENIYYIPYLNYYRSMRKILAPLKSVEVFQLTAVGLEFLFTFNIVETFRLVMLTV